MAREDLVIRIAGEAGEGVSITGQMVTQATARAGYYQELRNTGLAGGYSNDNGTTANITVAHPEAPGELGWRLQGWFSTATGLSCCWHFLWSCLSAL